MRACLIFFAFLSFITLLHAQTETQSSYIPKFTHSKWPPYQIKLTQPAVFGYLEVPENRENPEGSWIRLPVYIFKSRSKHPRPDPIIYTLGGPGSSTMQAAPYMEYYSYLDNRDMILFEQRGTEYARPSLNCPEWAKANSEIMYGDYTDKKKETILKKAAKACRNRLLAEQHDLNTYNTATTAADIEDLRKALRISQWNILSVSYSTKIAQVLMRDYPQGIRSVVMDSPLPLEASYDEESATHLIASFEKLFQDCEKTPSCHHAFPNLGIAFWQFLEEKTQNPLEITVPHPQTRKEITLRLKGKDIISLLDINSTYEIPYLPQFIYQILQTDYSILTSRIQILMKKEGKGLGMRLSVWCSEEASFTSFEKVASEREKYPPIKGYSPAVFDESICDIWGVKKVQKIENEAIYSIIPTLIINGEYDYNTPTQWGQKMKQNLPNSYHIVFKAWGHAPIHNWDNTCAMQAAHTFLNNPSQSPIVDCLDEIEPNFIIE